MGRAVYSQPSSWPQPSPPPPGHPAAAAGSGSSSTLKVVLIVLGVIAATTIGGCLACAGFVVLTGEQEQRAQKRNVIDDAQGRAIRLGTPERAVRARFGAPASPRFREERDQACDDALYYNIRGGEPGDQWQLCFERGRLAAKYRWA